VNHPLSRPGIAADARGRRAARMVAPVVLLLLTAAGARGQETLIDFDDRAAPSCPFSGAERVGDQWSALGVVFSAEPGSQTGAIQDQALCGWTIVGLSLPNFVAHVAGLADLPLHVDFDPPVESVSILATNWRGVDAITLAASDGTGAEVGRSTISTLGMVGFLQLLEVSGPGIVHAEITNTNINDDVAFDDLRFVRTAAEACCFPDATCDDLAPADCATLGGIAQGVGTDCATTTCPVREACCFEDGSCDDLDPGDCATLGGTAQGVATDCATTTCPVREACCFADGSCDDLDPADCATLGGTAQGVATDCATATCPVAEACCFADGSCDDLDPAGCATLGGTAQGVATDCATATCPMPGWPGTPLTVSRAAAGDLRLAWGLGCSADAVDHVVDEGTLGSWYDHEAVLCDTGGAIVSATLTPGAGGRYFLVVPVTRIDEGSYGLDSFGAERPRSTGATCRAGQVLGCP
jgi:hypothetical protein